MSKPSLLLADCRRGGRALHAPGRARGAAVIGVPDPYRGETVKAVVSLKPGQAVGAEELVAFCRERMAAYKYPRVVDIVLNLPKTPNGKIMRRALREGARLAGSDPAQE